MDEAISGRWSRIFYNSLLLGSASCAAYHIPYEKYPCSIAACLASGVISVVGLLRALFGSGRADECRLVRDVCYIVLELLPLPLINMDLYMKTQSSNNVALGHLICVLPLICELNCALRKHYEDCDTSKLLRELSTLGNIVSLSFLAFMEGNWLYARMALIMGVVKYGALFVDSMQDGTGESVQLLGTAWYLWLLRKALQEPL